MWRARYDASFREEALATITPSYIPISAPFNISCFVKSPSPCIRDGLISSKGSHFCFLLLLLERRRALFLSLNHFQIRSQFDSLFIARASARALSNRTPGWYGPVP